MHHAAHSLLLTDLTWKEVRDHLDRDRRLIVPVGACDQYGPHLTLGAGSLVAEDFARRLSEDFGVLRAPLVPFGVNVPSDRALAGAAGVRPKTLRSALNDILGAWEDAGFREFILLTAHDYDTHLEAVATATTSESRVRVIELLSVDLTPLLEGDGDAEHGGETLTSLVMHLHPDHVRPELAVDHPADKSSARYRRIRNIPDDSPGSIGQPGLASAEKGRRLYEDIYEKIRSRVFDAPD